MIKKNIETFLPKSLLSAYHFALAYLGAIRYGFPSRKMKVIAVTGTKGKSSVTEMINAMFEEAGEKTALLNSIRIKVGEKSDRNTMRMSMPGRFYIQRFLHNALKNGCTVAILEMTSEGARQHRHRAVHLDALVFTNLAPEHIESHGSLEAYANAKFEIGKQLARSKKRPRVIVANSEDPQSPRYLSLPVEKRIGFTLLAHEPYEASETGGHFYFNDQVIKVHLPGKFSLKNALAAASLADAFGIDTPAIARALEKIKDIPGRAERIEEGQSFTVVVDYAHTPDSLQALYDAYKSSKKICVLGNTGGGRDIWKRPVMGGIADKACDEVILTNEDPYDEDPRSIVDQMAKGMERKPTIIMDRREAIREALERATVTLRQAQGTSNQHIAVLITGKGTDPCICVEDGKKIPWSDAQVVREELHKLK